MADALLDRNLGVARRGTENTSSATGSSMSPENYERRHILGRRTVEGRIDGILAEAG